MTFPAIMEAHNRALVALLNATDMTEEQADEVITSIVALVFQTIKEYLPNEGDMKCN
jgi:hypothetical protein